MKASQLDLFVTYLTDLPLRDTRDLMAVPCFNLGKRKRIKPIHYKAGDSEIMVSAPAQYGMATIWDADVLIWAASQINDARERGLVTSARLHFQPYDLLRAIHRGTSGRDYSELRAALNRLKATTVETNIRLGKGRRSATFGWLEMWAEEVDAEGRSRGITIELPQWFYRAVTDGSVLAIDPAYFDMKGGLARWLYRLVRKHAGNQPGGWQFTVEQLHAKSGSTQRLSDFARDLRKVVAANVLPEYHVELYDGSRGDVYLHAVRRTLLAPSHPSYDANLLRELGKRRRRPKIGASS